MEEEAREERAITFHDGKHNVIGTISIIARVPFVVALAKR
jgi:hypothetical protein